MQEQYDAQRRQLEQEQEQRLKLESEKQALEARLAEVQARKEQHRTDAPAGVALYRGGDARAVHR